MKIKLLTGLFFLSASLLAQSGSEIFVFDFKLKKNGMMASSPVNITKHKGYDSQPFFHREKPLLYYSSFDEDDRSDIKMYDLKKKETINITNTPEREYSPTLTPDQQYLSCIIQRDNGDQDLGKYPVEGGEPSLIINDLKVGYHVWSDNSHIAVFVLGEEGSPNTLHFLRLPTKEDTTIAQNIGRSLHKIPGERAISFIQKGEAGTAIMKLETESMKISMIAEAKGDSEDISWTPDGRLITSDGSTLYFFDPSKSTEGWKPILLKSGFPLKGITRLAVNEKGDKLAVVASE